MLTDLASLLAQYATAVPTEATSVDGQVSDASDETGDLYADFVHDLDALRAMAMLTVPTGVETGKHIARVEYVTNPPHANYHKPETTQGWSVGSWFDTMQIWGTTRDRHLPGVLAAAVAAGAAPDEAATTAP